jgi:hypothetical protein
MGSRIIADQDHRQSWPHTSAGEFFGALPEVGAKLLGKGLAVENLNCHRKTREKALKPNQKNKNPIVDHRVFGDERIRNWMPGSHYTFGTARIDAPTGTMRGNLFT